MFYELDNVLIMCHICTKKMLHVTFMTKCEKAMRKKKTKLCPIDFLSSLWMEASGFYYHLWFSLSMGTSNNVTCDGQIGSVDARK